MLDYRTTVSGQIDTQIKKSHINETEKETWFIIMIM
jgi:hypothetical protein